MILIVQGERLLNQISIPYGMSIFLYCLEKLSEMTSLGNSRQAKRRPPVSYTHLDVYKRQDVCMASSIFSSQ